MLCFFNYISIPLNAPQLASISEIWRLLISLAAGGLLSHIDSDWYSFAFIFGSSTSNKYLSCWVSKSWRGSVYLEWSLGRHYHVLFLGTVLLELEDLSVIVILLASAHKNFISTAWLVVKGNLAQSLHLRHKSFMRNFVVITVTI